MQIDMASFLTITGMALVTYLTRASGLFMMKRATFSPRFSAWLNCLPGTVLISMVAPPALSSGAAEAGAAVATALVAFKTKSILPSMLAGIVAVLLLRAVV